MPEGCTDAAMNVTGQDKAGGVTEGGMRVRRGERCLGCRGLKRSTAILGELAPSCVLYPARRRPRRVLAGQPASA